MRIPPSPRESIVVTIAVVVALLFAASLAGGWLTYAFVFDRPTEPWTFRSGTLAVAVDVLLFSLFALHHSIFATPSIKQWIVRSIPPQLERTTYVLIASALFTAVYVAWRPVPGDVWRVDAPWSVGLRLIQIAGVIVTLDASRALDALDLAGVRQVLPGGAQQRSQSLIRGGFYRLVRHPIYFAWLLMVWPTPHMTGSRLTFAAVSTAYLLLAIPREERGLRARFGDDYAGYARRVPWRIMPFVY